jgi:hypothetical protein
VDITPTRAYRIQVAASKGTERVHVGSKEGRESGDIFAIFGIQVRSRAA